MSSTDMKIVLYTKGTCPYCVRAKQLLEREELDYEEIRIDLMPEKRDEMIAVSKGRKTVPQIFINNKHLGGCDDLFSHYREHGVIKPI